jgi:uncharacterized membrane protein
MGLAEPVAGRAGRKETRKTVRLVPDLDRSAELVRFVQTWPGRLLVLLVFAGLATLHQQGKPVVVGAAMAVLWPSRRRLWVFLATLGLALQRPLDPSLLRSIAPGEVAAGLLGKIWTGPVVSLSALILVAAYVQLARSVRTPWLRDRPVATWLSLYVGIVTLVSVVPVGPAQRAVAWSLVAALGGYVWFAAYSLKDRAGKPGWDAAMEASAYRPFWGGSNTPFPKAGSALAKIEVRTAEEAAVWQLKGVKLLAWALVLLWARGLLLAVVGGPPSWWTAWVGGFHLSIPDFVEALARSKSGTPLAAHQNWLALVRAFTFNLLDLSIGGHVVIAGARIAGFKALRNTFRPLASRSLADFWNRYYFYFKELLVDFFFFPTFLRFFKGRPRVRVLFATFAAAGFGNFLYHYLGATKLIATEGVVGALVAMQAYAIYALLLALGIGLSQIRKKPASPAGIPVKWSTLAGILCFYCLLQIPGAAPPGTTLAECWQFVMVLNPLR